MPARATRPRTSEPRATRKTVAELCDLYLRRRRGRAAGDATRTSKKASTLETDRGRIERHIKPLLGRRSVASVTRDDVEAFMHDVAEGKTAGKTKTKTRGLARVRGGKGTASRTVGLLGAIFSYAVRHRMRPDNPVHGVVRLADGRRERRLTDDEYAALGAALRQAEAAHIWPAAIASRASLPDRLAQRRGAGAALGRNRPRTAHRDARRHQNRAQRAPALARGVRCSARIGERAIWFSRRRAATAA